MSNHEIPKNIQKLVKEVEKEERKTRKPEFNPTLGISTTIAQQDVTNSGQIRTPRHRLVCIGDSLTHGFQSGAIYNTDLSYPMIIAWEMGCDKSFRHPSPYVGPGGGLPLNLEFLARNLQSNFGTDINWWELPATALSIRQFMDTVEDYWEREKGSILPEPSSSVNVEINHNLGIYGWKIGDVINRTANTCREEIVNNTIKNDWLFPLIQYHNQRAAIKVLDTARYAVEDALTPIQAAMKLSKEGAVEDGNGHGIETLIIMIGANNALGSVIELEARWSCDPNRDPKKEPTVWCPDDFKKELNRLVEQVRQIKARHVIWATVPHVTIAPIARGVGSKIEPGSRYYRYYTRPWIKDSQFDPNEDPHLTEQEARAIDTVIDRYNEAITNAVREARNDNRDWYLFDLAGQLDRLAQRRYIEDPLARPDWWTPYELPAELQALTPVPNTRFFASDKTGRTDGGLFSLDGVHPTTITYGLIAQELIDIMQLAGVKFYFGDASTTDISSNNQRVRNEEPTIITERHGPVRVDFNRLIKKDTLISDPPKTLSSTLNWLGLIDETLGFSRIFIN